MKCRVCNNNIQTFMSFGKMPLANGFLKEEDFRKEYFFDFISEIIGGFPPKNHLEKVFFEAFSF